MQAAAAGAAIRNSVKSLEPIVRTSIAGLEPEARQALSVVATELSVDVGG